MRVKDFDEIQFPVAAQIWAEGEQNDWLGLSSVKVLHALYTGGISYSSGQEGNMYDARQIANWFVQRAAADGRQLTIMQLLKLVYISHGWHLEMRHAPLFPNKIEAWKFGPVIPEVYNAFRGQGVSVQNPIPINGQPISSHDVHLLEQIYGSYGRMPAQKLSDMTHEPGGPWDQATKAWGYFAPIPNELILPHYQAKRARSVSS